MKIVGVIAGHRVLDIIHARAAAPLRTAPARYGWLRDDSSRQPPRHAARQPSRQPPREPARGPPQRSEGETNVPE